MSEPVRIVITMEGGLISGVFSLGVPVEALIIDYDTDGADEDDELTEVPQGPDTVSDAFVRIEGGEYLAPHVRAFALAQFTEAGQ